MPTNQIPPDELEDIRQYAQECHDIMVRFDRLAPGDAAFFREHILPQLQERLCIHLGGALAEGAVKAAEVALDRREKSLPASPGVEELTRVFLLIEEFSGR